MAKKGPWSRDRDAKKAAYNAGLKDDEFEITKGPRGYSYRKKKQYTPVLDAKLHVGKEPEANLEQIHEEVEGHSFIWKDKSTGRYRYSDETESFSQESWETIEEAKIALKKHFDWLHRTPKDLDSDVDKEQMTHSELGGCCPEHPVVETQEVSNLPPVLKQEIKEEGLDPNKEELQEKPVFSEKEQEDIRAKVEADHQVSEFSNGKLTPRIPIPRTHKSTVERPSKLVWDIAEEMHKADPQVRRKDIIEECVKQGIAFYTARTQYQVWLTVNRESASHIPKD